MFKLILPPLKCNLQLKNTSDLKCSNMQKEPSINFRAVGLNMGGSWRQPTHAQGENVNSAGRTRVGLKITFRDVLVSEFGHFFQNVAEL